MGMDHPSPEVIDAIESAVRWIDRSAIEGQRIEDIEIPPTRFEGHTATRDRIVVEDTSAPPSIGNIYIARSRVMNRLRELAKQFEVTQ